MKEQGVNHIRKHKNGIQTTEETINIALLL